MMFFQNIHIHIYVYLFIYCWNVTKAKLYVEILHCTERFGSWVCLELSSPTLFPWYLPYSLKTKTVFLVTSMLDTISYECAYSCVINCELISEVIELIKLLISYESIHFWTPASLQFLTAVTKSMWLLQGPQKTNSFVLQCFLMCTFTWSVI